MRSNVRVTKQISISLTSSSERMRLSLRTATFNTTRAMKDCKNSLLYKCISSFADTCALCIRRTALHTLQGARDADRPSTRCLQSILGGRETYCTQTAYMCVREREPQQSACGHARDGFRGDCIKPDVELALVSRVDIFQ